MAIEDGFLELFTKCNRCSLVLCSLLRCLVLLCPRRSKSPIMDAVAWLNACWFGGAKMVPQTNPPSGRSVRDSGYTLHRKISWEAEGPRGFRSWCGGRFVLRLCVAPRPSVRRRRRRCVSEKPVGGKPVHWLSTCPWGQVVKKGGQSWCLGGVRRSTGGMKGGLPNRSVVSDGTVRDSRKHSTVKFQIPKFSRNAAGVERCVVARCSTQHAMSLRCVR